MEGSQHNNLHWHMLSGSSLKVLAMVTMAIDHVAYFLLRHDAAFTEPLLAVGHKGISCCFLLRCVGRMAFPLFAFLLVEGFQHTRSRRSYGRNLLVLALLSEIPWDLAHGGHFWEPSQNVLFTLFLGFLGLCVTERLMATVQPVLRRKLSLQLLALLLSSIVLRCDYGCAGFGFILLLYVLRRHPLLRAVVGSGMLSSRWIAGLAFIPIAMYNGHRGFISGQMGKYIFYAFYPLHLLVLYCLMYL